MTAAEKFATSTAVTVAARIGMFLTPALITIALFVLSNYLSTQAEAMHEMVERIAQVEKAAGDVGGRVSTVETRINLGQAARDAFQAETRQALKEQSATLTQILQVQATILERIEKNR